MAGFQGRVRAVSESSLQPVTALASSRMVLFVVAHEAQPLARVFEPERNHREFHDETYSPGPLASPPGGRRLLALDCLDSQVHSAQRRGEGEHRHGTGTPAVGCPEEVWTPHTSRAAQHQGSPTGQ